MDIPVVDYLEEYGPLEFPDGFLDELRTQPLDEQLCRYGITESVQYAKTAYGEVTHSSLLSNKRVKLLTDYPELTSLIVRDGVLVGAMIRSWTGSAAPILPGASVCTYYASDNDGAGTSDREDYAYLICLPTP